MTTFKVKGQGHQAAHRRVGASGGCSNGRQNVLAVGNCCYVAVCSATRGISAPTGEEESDGCISWRHAHLQLVYINSVRGANRLWGEMSVRRKVHKTDRRTSRRRRRGAWRITGRRDGRNRLNTWPVCPAFSWRFVSYFHGLCVYIIMKGSEL